MERTFSSGYLTRISAGYLDIENWAKVSGTCKVTWQLQFARKRIGWFDDDLNAESI